MTQPSGMEAFLGHIARAFDASGVPYVLVGSLASSFHGEPRGTRDIDLVVRLLRSDVGRLAAHFPEDDFYFDREMVIDSLKAGIQFNIIDLRSMWKADIIPPRDPFTHEELDRRQRVELAGVPVFVATAEDTIIAKLRWARDADSGRQIDDVAGILRVRGGTLDDARIRAWVERLGLEAQWLKAVEKAAN